MPTRNRQQLAIGRLNQYLRQDYRHWEMIIVDDCSSSYQQLQQTVVEGAERPARSLYSQRAMILAPARYAIRPLCRRKDTTITGIDDDDGGRLTQNAGVFLAHKHQLTTRLLYANDYVRGRGLLSQPAVHRCIRNPPYSRRLFYKRNIGNRVLRARRF